MTHAMTEPPAEVMSAEQTGQSLHHKSDLFSSEGDSISITSASDFWIPSFWNLSNEQGKA